VLALVVAEHCYHKAPELPEGDLARIRAAVVSTDALAPVAAALGVGDAVLLGKGEAASGGRLKASILADTFEALIGACYLDGGLDPAREFVLGQLEPRIDAVMLEGELGDAKNRLQELAARRGAEPPRYVVRSGGPEHARWFAAEVYLGEQLVGDGRGKSKKRAEQAAAAAAWSALREPPAQGAPPATELPGAASAQPAADLPGAASTRPAADLPGAASTQPAADLPGAASARPSAELPEARGRRGA